MSASGFPHLRNAPWAIIVRFAMLLCLEAGFIVSVKSQALTEILARPFAGPLHFGPFPVQFSAILIAGFLITQWPRLHSFTIERKNRATWITGIIFFAATVALGIFITHPGTSAPNFLTHGGVEYPIVSALRYSVLVLILPASSLLLFPLGFLKKLQRPLLLCFLFLLIYIWVAALRIVFHEELAGFILRTTSALLSLTSIPVTATFPDLSLRFGSFAASIGAECLGLDSVGMYLLLCAALWALKPASSSAAVRRRIAGILLGAAVLYALNILRIALIMMIGQSFPGTAVNLFHGSIGALFLFIVFLITVRVLWRRTSSVAA